MVSPKVTWMARLQSSTRNSGSTGMRSELSFVIVIATMGICLLMCLWVIHQQFKSNQIQMTEMRQSLSSMTSLVAAKDIQAYAGLEAVRTANSVTFEQAPAMDDISVAQRM